MPDLPAFATTLRGYDRRQVDDYVTTLQSYLDEASERLERLAAAEQELAEARRELHSRAAPAPPREPAPLGWPART